MNASELEDLIGSARPWSHVTQPPVASIIRRGRRRRTIRIAAAAMAGAAAIAVTAAILPTLFSSEHASVEPAGTTTSLSEPGARRSNLTREEAAEYLRELPGVPLALPGSLPEEYRWIGPSTYEQDETGAVDARSSTFAASELSRGPVVEICAYGARNTCPQQAEAIERVESGQRVQISFSVAPSEAELTYWTEVPLDFELGASWLP